MQNEKLLIFTFSPVQGFILTARKPRDLFTASYIVSYLTEELIRRTKIKEKVIYPQLKCENLTLANYPNKFIALVEENICEKLKKEFGKIWEGIYESVWRGLNLELNEQKEKVYKQYLKHVKNYFTAFCECTELVSEEEWKKILEIPEKELKDLKAKDNYAYTYDLTERILGAEKSWRPYRNLVDDLEYIQEKENGEKKKVHPNGCTMCGERLHLAFDWKNKGNVFKKEDEDHIRKNEKLCGVCLVKRFAIKYYFGKVSEKLKKFWNFPSTEEIAGIKFKEKLEEKIEIKPHLKAKLEGLYEKLKDTPYILREGLLGYEKKALLIDSEIFRREGWKALFKEAEYLGKHKEDIENIYKLLKEEGLEHKNQYYSILLSDGDSIGNWLGIKSDIRNEPLSEEFHKKFSEKLSEYAKDITSIKDFTYQTIYAGGDDFMGFFHPADVVEFAKICAEIFTKRLKEKALKTPSISGGAVIAHVKINLQDVLEKAKFLEKRAKSVEGKGALAVGVMTRNASLTYFISKWEDIDTFFLFKEAFKSRELGQNFGYDLAKVAVYLKNRKEVFYSLLKRALNRKAKGEIKPENLYASAVCFIEKTKTYLKEENPIENFLNLLYVARFVAKGRSEL